MLVESPLKRIVEKIFRTETGEFIRATFLVVEFHGQIRGKIIKTEIISPDTFTANQKVLSLSEPYSPQVANFAPYIYHEPKVSPYFEFNFLVSQPTRAPARRSG